MSTFPRFLFFRLFFDDEEEEDREGDALREGDLEREGGPRAGDLEGDVPRPPMETGVLLFPACFASGPRVGWLDSSFFFFLLLPRFDLPPMLGRGPAEADLISLSRCHRCCRSLVFELYCGSAWGEVFWAGTEARPKAEADRCGVFVSPRLPLAAAALAVALFSRASDSTFLSSSACDTVRINLLAIREAMEFIADSGDTAICERAAASSAFLCFVGVAAR